MRTYGKKVGPFLLDRKLIQEKNKKILKKYLTQIVFTDYYVNIDSRNRLKEH